MPIVHITRIDVGEQRTANSKGRTRTVNSEQMAKGYAVSMGISIGMFPRSDDCCSPLSVDAEDASSNFLVC